MAALAIVLDGSSFHPGRLVLVRMFGLLTSVPMFVRLPHLEKTHDRLGFVGWSAPAIFSLLVCVWSMGSDPYVKFMAAAAHVPTIVVGLSGCMRRPPDRTADAF